MTKLPSASLVTTAIRAPAGKFCAVYRFMDGRLAGRLLLSQVIGAAA